MSLQDIINPPDPAPIEVAVVKEPKAPMRSWRKKYRKLKFRFDKVMDESNALFLGEHKQVALARRLQEENDQLLEILIDLNEQRQIPVKYNLTLPEDEEVGLNPRLNGVHRGSEDLHNLSALLKNVPHTEPYPGIQFPEDLTGDKPPAYLDTTYEEEFISNLDPQLAEYDAALTDGPLPPMRPPLSRQLPSEKELMTTNPNSVISWLRRHHPETFIQEKDQNSERSVAKPRGPGKRASLASAAAFGTPGLKSEHDVDATADDGAATAGLAPDDTERRPSGRARKHRGANQDDDAYRPKGGGGRAGTKRKRNTDGDGDTPKAPGRGKRAKAAPPPTAE